MTNEGKTIYPDATVEVTLRVNAQDIAAVWAQVEKIVPDEQLSVEFIIAIGFAMQASKIREVCEVPTGWQAVGEFFKAHGLPSPYDGLTSAQLADIVLAQMGNARRIEKLFKKKKR